MNSIVLECDGIADGPLVIPPLILRRGDAVAFQEPLGLPEGLDERLFELLTGVRAVPGLRLGGDAQWVSCIEVRPGPWRWWQRLQALWWPAPRATTWLQRHGGMSKAQANAVLDRLGMQDWRLNRLAYNPRMMLNLEAAFARNPALLVITMAGMDPLGQQRLRNIVTQRLNQFAVIYLLHPFWHMDQLHLGSMDGVPCHALGWSSAPPKLAKPA